MVVGGKQKQFVTKWQRGFFALYYFHNKISHKLVTTFLRHCCSTLKLPQGLSFFFSPWYCIGRGKKLEEEVICSHVCNFMIHDLIVIADVAQFFLQHYNPLLLLLLHKYNAANSLNLAVRQSRKTIIWKKEQVGDAHAGPNWGVFWLQGVMHIIQQPILAKQSRK